MGMLEIAIEALREKRAGLIDLVTEARSIWYASTYELERPLVALQQLDGKVELAELDSLTPSYVASLGSVSFKAGNPRRAAAALLDAIHMESEALEAAGHPKPASVGDALASLGQMARDVSGAGRVCGDPAC